MQASLLLSAFSCLFSEHTGLPMITCRFSGNQHLGKKKKKGVVLEKSYFKETLQAGLNKRMENCAFKIFFFYFVQFFLTTDFQLSMCALCV